MIGPGGAAALSGAVLAAGIAASFYGAHAATEGLDQRSHELGGAPAEFSVILDPAVRDRGVVAVQVTDGADAVLRAEVRGPGGALAASAESASGSIEEEFAVGAAGEYSVRISGEAGRPFSAASAVGHLPGGAALAAGAAGMLMVLGGMAGMAASAAYGVARRRRLR